MENACSKLLNFIKLQLWKMVRFKIQNFSHPFPKSSIEKVAGINGSLWSYIPTKFLEPIIISIINRLMLLC